MKRWFKLSKTEAWVLLVVLLGLVAFLLAEISTVRDSAGRVCEKCLAYRRSVKRTIAWRVVEDHDAIHTLAGNEDVTCQHKWIGRGGSSWSGFGNGYVWDGPASVGCSPELTKAIADYETRTGRDYRDEMRKITEAARKGAKK